MRWTYGVMWGLYTALICYDGLFLHRHIKTVEAKVAELENRIVVEDESRREIQRLVMERMKEEKVQRCRTKKKLKSL